jgi:GT2 family glycosyltransferase
MVVPVETLETGAAWPSVSVIIPTLGLRPTLEDTIASVLAQDYPGAVEVLIVLSAPSEAELARLPARPGVSVITRVPALSAPGARNVAIGEATGDLFVFTDDDAMAEPGWLRTLVQAAHTGLAASGSVVNGTPESAVGTCEYLLDRLECYPGRPATHTPWHGDTVNFIMPRAVWDAHGPFRENKRGADGRTIGGSDTDLTSRLRRAGLFAFAPEARVIHLNRTRARAMVSGQYGRGRSAAYLGRSDIDHPWSGLLRHPILAPVAAAARVFSVYRRCARWAPELWWRAVRLFPLLAVALGAWGAGLAREGRLIDHQRVPSLEVPISPAKGQDT